MSKKKLFVVIGIAVAVMMASRSSMADIQKCAAIDNASKRLACFDKFTKNKTREREYFVIVTGLDSGWKLLTKKPTGDRPGVLQLRTYSTKMWIKTDEETDLTQLKESRPYMLFQCKAGTMSGYVDLGIFIDFDRAKMAFKFDNNPSQSEVLKLSRDGKKIVSKSEKILISRIKEMMASRKLRIRITPIGEKPYVVTFDISGLATAIKPLRRACNW